MVMAVDVTLMMTKCAGHERIGEEIVVINATNDEMEGGRVLRGEGIVIIEMNAGMKGGVAVGRGVDACE